MRLVDLSSPVDARGWEPEPVTHEVITPAEGARHMAEEMREHFGIEFDPSVLDDGELLSIDTPRLTTHTGTHIDAPAHYGTRASYREGPPRTIDELPLEWFHRPAVVLDLTDAPPAPSAPTGFKPNWTGWASSWRPSTSCSCTPEPTGGPVRRNTSRTSPGSTDPPCTSCSTSE